MKKFFVDILTVANGEDYDVGRVMLLAGFFCFNILAAWALFKNQPWSAQDYGIGLGAIMGGGGAGLWFKRNTEATMSALLANPKLLAVLAFLLVIVLGFGYMDIRLKTSESELAKSKAANVVMQSQMATQNAAVLDMQHKAKALQDNLNGIELAQTQKEQIDKQEIQKLVSAKVPVDCNLATKWGAITASKIARSW